MQIASWDEKGGSAKLINKHSRSKDLNPMSFKLNKPYCESHFTL